MKRRGRAQPQRLIAVPDINVNEQITAEEVRLLTSGGESAGIMPLKAALRKAEEDGLDLVEIAPQSSPPVCKIMNHSKYLFDYKKRKMEAKKNQKKIVHKAIKFRPGTDVGDYDTKLKKIVEFLDRGNHVKVIVWFRGREMMHQDIGGRLLERVCLDLDGRIVVQSEPKMEGRQMIMVVAPTRKSK